MHLWVLYEQNLYVFRATWNDINAEFSSAILMLQSWKATYLEVRCGIESTRNFSIRRWEFEKHKLFAESEYINTVIRDLQNIFEVIMCFLIYSLYTFFF